MERILSNREVEVLKLIALEYTTKEIASQLFVSTETVRSHRKKLFFKMDVRNVAGLIRRGFEEGFLMFYVARENQYKAV